MYKPKGQYFNIQKHCVGAYGLALSPKLYHSAQEAQKDLDRLPDLKILQLRYCESGRYGLEIKAKPSWYDDRHSMTLTESQLSKLNWYNDAHARIDATQKFTDNLTAHDIEIIEIV
jgi:hypothetical protein